MACAGLMVVSACGGESNAAPIATVAVATTTASSTTTIASTSTTTITSPSTTSTSSSTSTSTTSTSTSVLDTLPNPDSPPPENASEPLAALGTIEIPKINVTKSIYEGITLSTLNHGPGHWPGTAMPGGQGNVVIAGHRVSHDKPFRNLDQLVPGDQVIMTTDAGRFVYQVTGTDIVYPDALWIVDQTADYTATLFACHPPGSTRQRIVVHLALVPGA
jgi:sortase A